MLGLAASAIAAPAALGFVSAMLLYADGPDFPARLGGWMALSLYFGVPVALFHAFAIALPFYSMLEARWPLRWWSAAIGGALVAMAPATILALVVVAVGAASGGALWQPLVSALALISGLGMAGVAGGLIFWLFARGDASGRNA